MATVETDVLTEIADLKARVERLEGALPEVADGSRTSGEAVDDPFALYRCDDEKLRSVVRELMRRWGIPDQPPSWTPQEVQEQMIREGVRPEDRIGNTILEEMRGYRK